MSQPANYKETRLEKQIEWHSNKARYNKQRFRQVQIITLVASAIIPIINVANIADLQTRIISSILGGIIVVTTGLTQLENIKKIGYYTEQAQSFFENSIGEYSNPSELEKNKLLVERVESIVSAETSKYFTIHQPGKRQPQQ
jgi:SMODS and SLOG-associating 2TM effector domain 1